MATAHNDATMPKELRRRPKRKPERTAQTVRPAPSRGGNPYNVHWCEAATRQYDAGLLRDPTNRQLQQQGMMPCDRTVRNWKTRLTTQGHMVPYEPNGNRPATVLVGLPLLLLSLFKVTYPTSTAAEARAFLFNAFPVSTLIQKSLKRNGYCE